VSIRVAIADDHALVRAGFRALLEAEPGLEVVGEAADGAEAPASPRPALDVLTDREQDVLGLVARGLSNIEIATELFITLATVKTHVSRLLTKLAARDRAQLIVIAYESGFVTPA
jgi:DNA-binding NarL/FixJ family response regulator